VKLLRAAGSGAIGGVVAIGTLLIGMWLFGVNADLCALFGRMLTGETGATPWLIGCAVQLVVAVVAGVVYAAIFEWVTERAGAVLGVLIAIPHVLCAGLLMGFLPADMGDIAAIYPGAFLEYRGAVAVVLFIVAHLLFGLVVGVVYGRPRRANYGDRGDERAAL
jgi:hypothetical protein